MPADAQRFSRWVASDNTRSLAACIHEAFSELRAVTAPSVPLVPPALARQCYVAGGVARTVGE